MRCEKVRQWKRGKTINVGTSVSENNDPEQENRETVRPFSDRSDTPEKEDGDVSHQCVYMFICTNNHV